jgi:hypothetical protein
MLPVFDLGPMLSTGPVKRAARNMPGGPPGSVQNLTSPAPALMHFDHALQVEDEQNTIRYE